MYKRLALLFLELCTLWTLAVAAPLLELLARYPDFLVLQGLGPRTGLGFAAAIGLLPPLLLCILVATAGAWQRRAGNWLLAAIATLLLFCFCAQLADRAVPSQPLAVALAAPASLSLVYLFARNRSLRPILRWGALSFLVFLGAYLVRSQPLARSSPPSNGAPTSMQKPDPTPVVLLVLDALPTSSLLDRNGDIDSVRFPNFARLRAEGIWFPRHTTVSDVTLKAVPAILTGIMPRENARPVYADHPQNLFTLLRDSHQVQSSEAITRLSPQQMERLDRRRLLEDTLVLCGHAALPDLFARRLPSISGRWRGFWGREDAERHDDVIGLVRRYRKFVRERERSALRPPLVVIHTILPHAPHHYLPTGARYSDDGAEPSGEGDTTGLRNHDEWAARHSFQRHLLQLGFVDRLLGELLDSLPEYDDALVIVTADHGVSFQEQEFGRWVSRATASDILEVPLLVKLPHGARAGTCDSSLTRSVDILPTIAQLLQFAPAQSFDGRSVLQGGSGGDVVFGLGFHGGFSFERSQLDRAPTLRRKIDWFADGAWDSLYAPSAYRSLLGARDSALTLGSPSALTSALLETQHVADAADEPFLDVELVGVVQRPQAREPFPPMAVMADGQLLAVTRPYLATGRGLQATWSALLSQPAAGDPRAGVELYALAGDAGGGFVLHPIRAGAEFASLLNVPLGARYLSRVEESGFTRRKPYGRTDYRWTTERVRLVVPLHPDDRIRSIELDIAQAAPQGTRVRLTIGGDTIFDVLVPTAGAKLRRAFEPQQLGASLEIVLECETFLRDDPDGGPQRPLGVALRGITLSDRAVQGSGE